SLRDGDELVVVDDCSPDDSVSWMIKKFGLKLIKKSFNKGELPKKYNPDLNTVEFKLYTNKILVNDSKGKGILKGINKKKITVLLVSQLVNLRFGATANLGVAMSSNDNIFLLNSDVKPTKTVVDQLLTNFSDDKVFAVGCLEYEKSKSGDKSGKNKLWFSQGFFRHSKADNFRSGKTAWASGGSGMFNRKKYLELGGFDKLYYPAYWEDIDLSFRALKRGWKVLFDEKAVVYHVHETTNIDEFGKAKINVMSWNNSHKFVLKNGNIFQKLSYWIWKPYWDYKHKKSLAQEAL
ncbi:glycosyltransferase, partial [Patescibacteria group bacterium]|nr:glycosyltransferase [Patescibacteria group bacterium]